jgi:hypothetical protein
MSEAIFEGRYAAHTDDPFVVFLIGISINRRFAIRRWLPHLRAMFPMVRELSSQQDKGMIGSRFFISPRPILTFIVVQYWRSFEALEKFARNTDDLHLPAWRHFNQQIGKSKDVGVFHETYLIQPRQYEAVYVNMPRFGLARAVEHIPAVGQYLTARRRLGGNNMPAVAIEE